MFLNVEMYPRRTVLNASQAPPGIRSKLDRTGLGEGGGGGGGGAESFDQSAHEV